MRRRGHRAFTISCLAQGSHMSSKGEDLVLGLTLRVSPLLIHGSVGTLFIVEPPHPGILYILRSTYVPVQSWPLSVWGFTLCVDV